MAAATTVSIKLLVDTKNNKVLFAEAGKDFVDFLFNLLALRVGTVFSLLKKEENMVGSLGNLYWSVESLSSTYMQPNFDRNSLLQPKTISSHSTGLPLLLGNDQMSGPKIFRCGRGIYTGCSTYVTVDSTVSCPGCSNTMSNPANWVDKNVADVGLASGSSVGYVMGVVTYMVMDDLVVKPMSTISSITMLNKFNVKDVGVLEEKVVELNMAEGLKLLKESLMSEMVLTNVFLPKSSV